MSNILPYDPNVRKEETFEKLIKEFDQNMKIVEFFIETESYYDLDMSLRNINKTSKLISDCFGIVFYKIKI
jgi:hypothetical protein